MSSQRRQCRRSRASKQLNMKRWNRTNLPRRRWTCRQNAEKPDFSPSETRPCRLSIKFGVCPAVLRVPSIQFVNLVQLLLFLPSVIASWMLFLGVQGFPGLIFPLMILFLNTKVCFPFAFQRKVHSIYPILKSAATASFGYLCFQLLASTIELKKV